jgi:hypothetical protein
MLDVSAASLRDTPDRTITIVEALVLGAMAGVGGYALHRVRVDIEDTLMKPDPTSKRLDVTAGLRVQVYAPNEEVYLIIDCTVEGQQPRVTAYPFLDSELSDALGIEGAGRVSSSEFDDIVGVTSLLQTAALCTGIRSNLEGLHVAVADVLGKAQRFLTWRAETFDGANADSYDDYIEWLAVQEGHRLASCVNDER